jgi:hypothetical protein
MKSKSNVSVSLKINKTCVTLYRNEYVKAGNGLPGMTAQHYIASFSTKESVVPSKFDNIMRDLTVGDPIRFERMQARIEKDVLIPRRAEIARLEAAQVKAKAVAALDRSICGLSDFKSAWTNGEVDASSDVKEKTTELTSLISELTCAINAKSPRTLSLGTRISEMLAAIKDVRDMLAVAPTGQELGLTLQQTSDWRMSYFAFSQTRDHAGGHRAIAAKNNWATNEWADEAIARGFADADKTERARAKARLNIKPTDTTGRPC